MNDAVVEREVYAERVVQRDPHQLAWGVLLVSFAVFCLLCAAVGLGVHYFMFESRLPMMTVLQVGRGSVEIVEPAVGMPSSEPARSTLTAGTSVRVNPQSQATITLRDAIEEETVAAITLLNGASFNFARALGPRFDWSTGSYGIDLRDVTGELDVFIADRATRDVTMTLRTRENVLIYLNGPGRYTLNSSINQVRLFNRSGIAHVVPPGDSREARSVPVGGMGLVFPEAEQVTLTGGPIDILRNSNLQEVNPRVSSGTPQELLTGWFCTNETAGDPRGTYRSQILDGRMTLKFERAAGATTWGSTSCFQPLGPVGYDLSENGINYLELRTTFYVTHQSLNACGTEGSECPLMLQMDYVDERGTARRWFHGFYTVNEAGYDYPLTCSSCTREHEAINPRTWYTFSSGNMFNLLPAEQRPRSIINIKFYASGHAYDVNVSQISLLAGQQVMSEVVAQSAGES